jgi:uncharacterized delta-60 repeat protein
MRLRVATTLAALPAAALTLAAGVAFAATAGDLDPAFDGDGRRILPFAAIPGHVLGQPDGKIVVTDRESFTVLRLNPDGSLDTSFGGDGAAAVDFGPGAKMQSAALQRDGKIVVAGQTGSFLTAIARLNVNGSLDRTFAAGGPDGDGKKVGGIAPWQAAATIVQPDGRIVIAGGAPGGMTISRLNPTGSDDGTEFDYADFPDAESETVSAAALAPDGSIVLAGTAQPLNGSDHNLAAARFSPEGSLDTSLAGTGMTTFGPGDRDDVADHVLVQPDGKILLAGNSGSAEKKMAVTRLNRDGTLDTGFGDGGMAAPDFEGKDSAAGAALQPDGKILIAGTTDPGAEFAVARLDSAGVLDAGFGAGGKTTIAFDAIALAYAAGLQPDGRLVIAGLTLVQNQTAARTVLARVLADQPPGTGPRGGGPGAGGAGGGPDVDRVAPVIGRVTLTPAAFAVARGTVIAYSLSEPAAVTLKFKRATPGRRVGGSCVALTTRNRDRRPCRRYVPAGTLRRAGHSGPNRIAFSGRIGGRALRRGAHRLLISAIDAAGNRATSRARGFRIVRKELK